MQRHDFSYDLPPELIAQAPPAERGASRMLVLDGRIADEAPPYVGSRGWLTDLRLNGKAVTVPELVETLMHAHFQHHYPLVYGDFTAASLELAAWLDVAPIAARRYTPYLQR